MFQDQLPVRVVCVTATALITLSCATAAAEADAPDYSLTVGVPRMTRAGQAWAGLVDNRGLGGHFLLSEELVGTVSPSDMSNARFGSAFLVKDVDGDGYDDLVVGAPGHPDRTGQNVPGRVDLLFGTATGISAARAMSLVTPALAGDEFGAALSLSARADDSYGWNLWVGAPGHDVGDATDAGAVFRYALSVDGTPSYVETVTQNNPLVPGIAETDDRFGSVLSGDGGNRTAVGVPNEDLGALADAGTMQLLHTHWLDNTLTQATALNQNSPGVPGTAEAGDHFGAAIASGGLLVGVPGEDVGRIKNAGLVQTFGYPRSVLESGAYTQNSPGVPGVAEAGDRFGAAVSDGIFQCNEQITAAVGAPGEDVGQIRNAGSVTLILQTLRSGLKLSQCPAQVFRQGRGLPGTAETDDQVGSSMGVRSGDPHLDEDRTDAVLIGVPYEDVGTVYDAGRVIVGTGSGALSYGHRNGSHLGMRFGSIFAS